MSESIRYVDQATYRAIVDKIAAANVLMAQSRQSDLTLKEKIALQARAKVLRTEAHDLRDPEPRDLGIVEVFDGAGNSV